MEEDTTIPLKEGRKAVELVEVADGTAEEGEEA